MVRTRNSAEQWRRLFREHRASGLPVSVYCRRAGVPQSSFYAWRRRLRDSADFVEVRLPSRSGAHVGVIELRLPGARSVMIRPGFDQGTLRELVSVLESIPHDGEVPEPVLGGAHREVGG